MKSIKQFLKSGAVMLALSLVFTSCGNIDNPLENIGTNDLAKEVSVLGAALEEGALISYSFTDGTNDYTVTFKKVGDTYVRQTPAATRAAGGWLPTNKVRLIERKSVAFGSCLQFTAYGDAAGRKPRLEVTTDIAKGTTQITQISDPDDPTAPGLTFNEIRLNGESLQKLDNEVTKAKNGRYVVFKTDDSDITFEAKVTYSGDLYLNNKDVETWNHYIEFLSGNRVANRLLLYVEGGYVNAKLLCGEGEHSEDIEFQAWVNDNRLKASDIIFPGFDLELTGSSQSGGTVVCILKRVILPEASGLES